MRPTRMWWSWCESWQRPGPIRTLQVYLIAPAIRPVPVKGGSLKHTGDNAMPVAFVQPETRRLLGCQVVGAKAAEIVESRSNSLSYRIICYPACDLAMVHPSASEALVRCLQSRFDRPGL